MCVDSFSNLTAAQNNINNVITALGGSTSKIVITFSPVSSDATLPVYNSSYDAVLYYSTVSSNSNGVSIINQYQQNGKGVVCAQRLLCSDAGNPQFGLQITYYNNAISSNASAYSQNLYSAANTLLQGVSTTTCSYYNTTFTPINGFGTSFGNANGNPIGTYYNKFNYRKVDLNIYPTPNLQNDTTSVATVRLILQSL